LDADLLGLGLYSIPEAARLTTVSQGRIRRWVAGYAFRVGERERFSEPVWQSDLPRLNGSIALSFLDLLEVRFINALREAGIGWRNIRLAVLQAQELMETKHPFTTKAFKTDGKTIFAEILRKTGEKELLDLVKRQYAFRRVISPSLYAGIEFASGKNAVRWWPMGTGRRVVIDPKRAFGQPIVSKMGVPTAVLKEAYDVEDSVQRVAKWFGVDVGSVRDAIRFEERLAA